MSIEAISWAFKQPVKPAAKKFVLVALADNTDGHGICFPSYSHIEKKTSLSRRAVIQNISDLVKEGFIKKVTRSRANGSDTSNAYRLPIVEGSIEDHPLSCLFAIDQGVQEMHPPVQEMHPPVQEMHPPRAGNAPLEPSINRHITEKEKKPLSREGFLRAIDGGYTSGAFQEWGHLTETEIRMAAEACLDFYGAKGEWPAGEPVPVLRYWIRKGIKDKTIRSAPSEKALQESKPIEPEELQPWQERIRPMVGDAAFRSWLLDCEYNGNGHLYAPTAWKADQIRQKFSNEIARVLPDVEIVHVPEEKRA